MNSKNLKRTFIFAFLLIIILSSVPDFSFANNNGISVYLDSKKIEFNVDPILKDGRVLVPMRKIFEELGSKVTWDSKTKSVSTIKNNKKMKLTIDNNTINVNGKDIIIDTAPILYKSHTLVPLRIISETYGLQVNWLENTKEVRIISNPIFVKNNDIILELGMSIDQLKFLMGEPDRIEDGEMNSNYYTYNNKPNTYKDYIMIQVKDNRIIGFSTNSKNWILSGNIKVGNKYSVDLYAKFKKKHNSNNYTLNIYNSKSDNTISNYSIVEK